MPKGKGRPTKGKKLDATKPRHAAKKDPPREWFGLGKPRKQEQVSKSSKTVKQGGVYGAKNEVLHSQKYRADWGKPNERDRRNSNFFRNSDASKAAAKDTAAGRVTVRSKK